ncbi:hypothetical protein PAAG_04226 [Paracoccidioides lutzii Pb01]|uniref:Uncharacterized protein n=1 Tax=Paracoccidioides lutzii (strain ATCC MYA-826 / Pb01) TaxID=502779 RepID=C1H0D2_PARBA|nr:hypothetical protein PAAG_04226 [Paracoccidioides lutzii Pb01]EEH33173.2 hypothetical protein PAAG_04226 [Paracoccidioides lutzii Pb01]
MERYPQIIITKVKKAPTSRTQAAHEVQNNAEDEDLRGRERHIDGNLSNPQSTRSVEGESSMLVHNWMF